MVKKTNQLLFWTSGHLGRRMESHDYEHYRNLTLMFFFEKLLEKGGEGRIVM